MTVDGFKPFFFSVSIFFLVSFFSFFWFIMIFLLYCIFLLMDITTSCWPCSPSQCFTCEYQKWAWKPFWVFFVYFTGKKCVHDQFFPVFWFFSCRVKFLFQGQNFILEFYNDFVLVYYMFFLICTYENYFSPELFVIFHCFLNLYYYFRHCFL